MSNPAVSPGRAAVSAAVLLGLAVAAYIAHANGRPALSLSIMLGAAFGIVLQRARFCFFCNFRDWLDSGDARPMLGILTALGVGTVGYALVFGAWLPDPFGDRLPPDAFIGPVSPALAAAGLTFGAGMAISGSCVSAHLYRLGEGSPTAPFALAGTVVGFMLGFASWNAIYIRWISDGATVWLPRSLGYAGTIAATLIALTALAALLSWRSRPQAQPAPAADAVRRILVERWPSWIGGAIVGVIAMVAYLRVAPLGVTAEIGGRSRELAGWLGILPQRLEGLDTLRGCVTLVRDALLSNNGGFVTALVVAAFAAAFVAGQFQPARPTADQVVRGLTGGVLLGWGATIGLGCTVGTLLSGIMAGALSGWIFGAAVFAGVAATLRIGRAMKVLPVG